MNDIVLSWRWNGHNRESFRVLASYATSDEFVPGHVDENTLVEHTTVARVGEYKKGEGGWCARVWYGGGMNPVQNPNGEAFISQQEAAFSADEKLRVVCTEEGWILE